MGKKDNESHLLRIAAFAGEVGACNDLQVADHIFLHTNGAVYQAETLAKGKW